MKTCFKCKKEKPFKDFYKNSHRKDGRQTYCIKCSTKIRKEYYTKNKSRERKNRAVYKKRISDWLKEYKSNLECTKCGENHIATLQFHHESDKEFNISEAVSNAYSIRRIEKEISKCTVLCANCHFKLHYEENK